jgi:putative thioredoxin
MAIDVTDAQFEAQVIERSKTIPVLVDFWATWCCQTLAPVLAQIAEADAGRFELVKVDTEKAPEAAARLGIRSIPNVKLFIDGKPVAEFVGALPGGSIRKFLDEHLPSPADTHVAEGRRALASGDLVAARTAFDAAIAIAPKHGGALLGLARLALHDGDAVAFARWLDEIDPRSDEDEAGDKLRRALVLLNERDAVGGTAVALARTQADANDVDAWYGLGCCHAIEGHWEPALVALLESIKLKPKHRDAAAHKAMLAVFGLIGRAHELTDAYQRQLQIYT